MKVKERVKSALPLERGAKAESKRQKLFANRNHFAAQIGNLALQGEMFGAEIVAGEQRHTCKHAIVIAHNLEPIVIVALVMWVEHEAHNAVHSRAAHEIFAHELRSARGDAATAFNAAVELENFIGNIGLNAFFNRCDVGFFLAVNPAANALAHAIKPIARIDRKVFDELECGQRHKRNHRVREALCERAARKARLPINHHTAATADSRSAHEVEVQIWVKLLPNHR